MNAPISTAIRAACVDVRRQWISFWDTSHTFAPCAICKAPNRPNHTCKVRAIAQITKRVWKRAASGTPYRRTLWEGFLFENGGAVWRCHHHHEDRTEAVVCAVTRLTQRQRRRPRERPVNPSLSRNVTSGSRFRN